MSNQKKGKSNKPKVLPSIVPKEIRKQVKSKLSAVPVAEMPYLHGLLNPGQAELCGIPDASLAPTFLYPSQRVMDVYVDFGLGSSSGRFAIAIQPKLGSSETPLKYNIAMTSFNDATAMDFTSPSAYQTFASGVDPRVDDNAAVLTMNQVAFWAANFPNAANPTPLATPTLNTRNYGVDIDLVSGTSVRFPPGQWAVYSQLFVASGGATITWSGIPGITGLTRTSTDNTLTTNVTYLTTTALLNTLTIALGGAGTRVLDIYVVPVRYADSPWTENYGLCKKIRPVACAALFTYCNTTLMNGGRVTSHLVPGDTLADNFFTNNPVNNGQYQLWERLEQCRGAYSGPIHQGCYTYYTPETDLDYQLRSPDDANNYAYPSIVIAGEFNPGTTQTGLVSVGRLIVWSWYEGTTNTSLLETHIRPGSRELMDSYSRVLAEIPRSMPNGKHWDMIKGFMQKAGRVLWDKRKQLLQAAELIAPVVGMLV